MGLEPRGRMRNYQELRKKRKLQKQQLKYAPGDRCWDELPDGPLIEIAERLSIFEDFQALPLVCRRWHSVLRSLPSCKFLNKGHVGHCTREIPWLMVTNRKSLSLTRLSCFDRDRVPQMIIGLPPQLDGENFGDCSLMSSRGWLFVVTRGLNMSLYNPLCDPTHNYIPLPRNDTLATRGTRFTLSACPCTTNTYTIMLVCLSDQLTTFGLAFWSPGDEGWTFTRPPHHPACHFFLIDVTFYEGHYYALDASGGIVRTSSYSLHNWSYVTRLDSKHIDTYLSRAYFVVVESSAKLLVVVRLALGLTTAGFRVFRITIWDQGDTVIQVKNLGNISLFVGCNDAFAVQVPKERNYGCKPNCIYFTDDRSLSRPITAKGVIGKDMGVYNMVDGSIDRDFQGRLSLDGYSPMMWV